MKPDLDTSLDDWINWLLSLHADEIDLGLERIRCVASKMGLLKPNAKVITLAGTNGKGSSLAMLKSIYQAAGFQVGAYTSPHLIRFNERIQLPKGLATDAQIIAAFDAIEKARSETKLTYFEFSTLAALYVFQQATLDVILLEVGLGGRLDAVNIIDADLALITAIDIDHVDWLGDDRNQIAIEKAGVMRATKPAVCSDPRVPQTLIDYAEKLGAPLSLLKTDFDYVKQEDQWRFVMQGKEVLLPLPALEGEFQLQNASGVLAAVELMAKFLPVDKDALEQGLKAAVHDGRMQRIFIGEQQWLLDVAHNPQSANALAESLTQNDETFEVAIFSALADKDILPMLKPLASKAESWLVADLNVPRAQSVEGLTALLAEANVQTTKIQALDSIGSAVASVKDQDVQRVLVFGSFFTVSQALETLNV